MGKFSLLMVLGATSACWGDTLTLKNGDVIEGTYLGGTARLLRMEVNGRVLSYDISMVNGLQFASPSGQPGSYSQAAPPPPLNAAPPPPPLSSDNDRSPRRASQGSSSDDDRPVLRRAPQIGDSQVNPPSNYPPANNPPVSDDARVARSESPAPSNSSPAPQGFELPSGTPLTVRMIDSVDSEVARLGDTFRGSLDEPVILNGQTMVARGADVVAKLVEDQQSGKLAGKTVLKLTLVSIKINDRMVDVSTQDVVRESGSRGARSGKVIGGTAALGAIIGGIAGGGKGAAIGAGSGAAVGTGAQEVTKGQRVKIPSETRLVFTLAYSVRV